MNRDMLNLFRNRLYPRHASRPAADAATLLGEVVSAAATEKRCVQEFIITPPGRLFLLRLRQLRVWTGVAIGLAGLALCGTVRSAEEGSPANSPVELDAFKLIYERNIFDPTRQSPSQRPLRIERAAPTRVDKFALVGTVIQEDGAVALFNGTESDFRRGFKVGGSVGGCTITRIEPNKVALVAGENEIELATGMHLKREEGGEWQLVATTEAFGASPSGSPLRAGFSRSEPTSRSDFGRGETPSRIDSGRTSFGRSETVSRTGSPSRTATSSTSEISVSDDFVKQLMEQREKEMQK